MNFSYLSYSKSMGNQNSQHQANKDQIVVSESILILIVCSLHYFMVPHVPDRGKRSSNED